MLIILHICHELSGVSVSTIYIMWMERVCQAGKGMYNYCFMLRLITPPCQNLLRDLSRSSLIIASKTEMKLGQSNNGHPALTQVHHILLWIG